VTSEASSTARSGARSGTGTCPGRARHTVRRGHQHDPPHPRVAGRLEHVAGAHDRRAAPRRRRPGRIA
jgi:hypothetical protein